MNTEPEALLYNPLTLNIPWQWTDVGYGEIAILIRDRGKKIEIWNDNLTKEEVEKVLLAFVRKVMYNGKIMESRAD